MKNQHPNFVSSTTARNALFCLTLVAFKLTLAAINIAPAYSTQPVHPAQIAQTAVPAHS
ncbi:MAG: hypothetical protein LCH73_11410 [Proteobacteria bacterium]|nr:hypothetical protein [Pseudomonadota bacterium]